MISCFVFIFTTLGTRKSGSLSAYSIFNKNFEKLPGEFSADQMLGIREPKNNNIENKIYEDDGSIKFDENLFAMSSKLANKPCPCGSEKKFKKCCYLQ